MTVFISHSFENKPEFDNVADQLEQANVSYWDPNKVQAGGSLRDQLRTAVDQCSVCVFIAPNVPYNQVGEVRSSEHSGAPASLLLSMSQILHWKKKSCRRSFKVTFGKGGYLESLREPANLLRRLNPTSDQPPLEP